MPKWYNIIMGYPMVHISDGNWEIGGHDGLKSAIWFVQGICLDRQSQIWKFTLTCSELSSTGQLVLDRKFIIFAIIICKPCKPLFFSFLIVGIANLPLILIIKLIKIWKFWPYKKRVGGWVYRWAGFFIRVGLL